MESVGSTFGISLQGFIALRKDPVESSEMTSQVLFGESVEIMQTKEKWLYIKSLSDGYAGWIDRKCIKTTKNTDKFSNICISNDIKLFNKTKNIQITLPAGALLPEITNKTFKLCDEEFDIISGKSLGKPGAFKHEELIPHIISTPYLWGGKCGYGFDCSGLSQYYCRAMGKEIPRDASEQAKIGTALNFLSEVKPGDLAFFDNDEGTINHVGIVLDDMRILHASGYVRIDKLDQQGIYNETLGKYTHKLRIIKSI